MYMHDCVTIIGSYCFITSSNLTKSISVSSFAKKNHTGGFLAYFIGKLTKYDLMNGSSYKQKY